MDIKNKWLFYKNRHSNDLILHYCKSIHFFLNFGINVNFASFSFLFFVTHFGCLFEKGIYTRVSFCKKTDQSLLWESRCLYGQRSRQCFLFSKQRKRAFPEKKRQLRIGQELCKHGSDTGECRWQLWKHRNQFTCFEIFERKWYFPTFFHFF